jgi:hypothetical protein
VQPGAYLLTALRVHGDTVPSLAATVAREVAALVMQGRVSGRAFARVSQAALDQWAPQPQPETCRGSSWDYYTTVMLM